MKPLRRAGVQRAVPDRTFGCSDCGKTFATRASLHEHSFIHGGDSTSLTCQECGERFSRLRKLALHMRASHGRFTKTYLTRLVNGFSQTQEEDETEESEIRTIVARESDSRETEARLQRLRRREARSEEQQQEEEGGERVVKLMSINAFLWAEVNRERAWQVPDCPLGETEDVVRLWEDTDSL